MYVRTVCMYACIYVCMYVCIYVCMCTLMKRSVKVVYVCIYVCSIYACKLLYSPILTYIHQQYIHTYIQYKQYIHTYRTNSTYIHTYIHKANREVLHLRQHVIISLFLLVSPSIHFNLKVCM